MHRSPTVLFLIALLSASGIAQADPINTFSFTGTLERSFANQTAVTGQFSVNPSTLVVTDYSFTTPIGILDPTHNTPNPLLSIGPNLLGKVLAIFSVGPLTESDSGVLLLAFPGTVTTTDNPLERIYSFSGGPLYTGPIEGIKFYYSDLDCVRGCGPTGYISEFTSGSATLISAATPEPMTFTLFGCALLFCLGRHLKQKPERFLRKPSANE